MPLLKAETVFLTTVVMGILVLGFISTQVQVAKPIPLATGSATADALSPNGLRLVASINATTIKLGQRLNISISILNTLSRVNDFRTANDWLFRGVPVALWPPGYTPSPAEIAILNGTYNLQDLSAVANVTFTYTYAEAVGVDHVIFGPSSDSVILTGIYDVTNANQTLGPFRLSLNFTATGYWNLKNLSMDPPMVLKPYGLYPVVPSRYIPFVPGEYTIAIADEWGQAVILHLTVLPAGPPIASQSSSASSVVHTITACASGITRSECVTPSVTYTGVTPACVIAGQPSGAYLRILSDSTLAPVTGAVVKATHTPATQVCDGVEYVRTGTSETLTYSDGQWMALDTADDGSYSFTVGYSGHTYIFTEDMGPLSVTCSTLYVPSGRTNTTITFLKSSCP